MEDTKRVIKISPRFVITIRQTITNSDAKLTNNGNGSCLPVFPADSLISSREGEKEKNVTKGKERKEERKGDQAYAELARASRDAWYAIGIGVSRDVGKRDCIDETNGTGTMNHRNVKSTKRSHHFAAASLNPRGKHTAPPST